MDNPGQESFANLPLPSREDDLETTLSKVPALSEAVQKGQSLALRTGQHVPEHAADRRDAESIARSVMSIQERQSYDAWKAGHHPIPDINWTEHVALAGTGPRSRKKFEQRAQAMDVIWGGREQDEDEEEGKKREGDDDGHARDSSVKAKAGARATPENALWLTLDMPATLPLIKAVVRVSNAEKQARLDPYYALSEMEVIEIKTVRKTIATMDEKFARAKAEVRKHARDINES